MVKQFFKDSVIYGIANVLTRGISLLLLPLYTRVLSPVDYGTVDILTIFATLTNLTVALEISQAVARYFTDVQTKAEKAAYASTALWFTCIAYIVFIVTVYLISTPFSYWLLESSDQVIVFRVALLSIFGFGLYYLAQNQLRWQLQPILFAIASFVFSFVSITASIIFVWILQLGVIGVIYGQLVGNFVGATLALYFARQNFQFIFDWAKCKEMLQFSTPLVPSSIGVFITLYIDRIAIKELLTIADVGLFGVGYRLASLISLLIVGIQAAITPLIYTHYREPNTPIELERIFRYFVAGALLLCLILSLFSREILIIFTTPKYYAASSLIPFLAPAILLSGMYVFAPGLGIAKRTGVIATINIFGALLNSALSFSLIPIFGIQGAALGTLLSSIVIFTSYMIYSQKLYFIPHRWLHLSSSTLVTMGITFIGTQVSFTWSVEVIIKLLLVCFALSIFIWLGLIEISAMKRLWDRFINLQILAKA